MKNLPWQQVQSAQSYQTLDDERKKIVQEKWYEANVKAHPQYAKLNPQQEQQVRQTLFTPQKQAGPSMGQPEIGRNTANQSAQTSQNKDTNWTDYAKALAGGALNTGQLLLRGAQVASPLPDIVSEKLGAGKALRGLENVLKRGEESLSESQSEEWKQAQATKYLSDKEGELFGDAWSLENLGEKVGGTILRSAPSMALGMGAGRLIIGGLVKAGMNKGLAGIIGSAIGEGGVAGGDAAKTAYDTVISAPDEQLVKSEEYRDAILKVDPSLPIEEQHAQAKQLVAKDAAIKTGAIVTAAVSTFGAPSGAAMGRLVGGEAGKTAARTIAKQAGLEAAQEVPQSAVERLSQNVVEREYVDPEKDIFEDVAEAAVEGGIAGAVMGGAMGGAVRPKAKSAATTGEADADVETREQPASPEVQPEFDATQTIETGPEGLAPATQETPAPENVREITQQGIDPNAITPEIPAEELAAEAEAERKAELTRVKNLEAAFKRNLNDADRAAIQADVKSMSAEEVSEVYFGDNPADKYARNFARMLELDPTAADKISGQASRRAAREIAPEQRGTAGRTYTPRNNPIDFEYAVVEAGDLIASHTDQFQQDPDYPQELQPRDRSRAGMEVQVNRMANSLIPEKLGDSASVGSGAPIVGEDLLVESGNGRTIALRKAYEGNKAEGYRQYLAENAERFGVDPAQLSGMDRPMLVRIRKSNVGRTEFVKEANQPEVAGMSPAEQAKADAESITGDDLSLLAPDESGNLSAASNDVFVGRWIERMGSGEAAGLLTADGKLTKQGYDRLQSAVFAKAYGDPQLVEMQAEAADPDIKNILNALTAAAPEFAQARGIDAEMGGLDIARDIAEGAQILRQARADGVSVRQVLDQQGLFGQRRPETEMMARFLDENIKSSKRMGIAIKEMGRMIREDLLNRNQQSLFGDRRQLTAEQVVERGINVGNESAGRPGQPGASARTDAAESGTGQPGGPGRTAPAYAGPRPAAEAGIGLDEIRQAFPRQTVKENPDGSYTVSTPGKRSAALTIKTVDHIAIDEASFEIAYRRKLTNSQRAMGAAGSYRNGEIRISKIGDRWTLRHESFHHLVDSGMLSGKEIESLRKVAREDGAASEEEVAMWLEDALARREEFRERGTVYAILQKIGDFIDGLANAFTTTAGRTVRGMESGEIFNREAQADPFGQMETSEAYQADEIRYSVPDEIREIAGRRPMATLRERADELKDYIKRHWRTRIFDTLHPIKGISERAYKVNRNAAGVASVMQGFMEHGKLEWEGPAPVVNTQMEGFIPWFSGLGEDGMKLLYWVAAKRAERLEGEKRESWLTDARRKKIYAWTGETAKDGRKWSELNKELQEWNQNVLDFSEKAGFLKKGEWAAEEFYIPFYRILEDPLSREEFLKGPRKSGKYLDNQIRKLSGKSETKFGDPLENLMKNWSHLITESVRNNARRETVQAATERRALSRIKDDKGKFLPIVQEVPASAIMKFFKSKDGSMTYVTRGNDENVLSYLENGEKKYVKVNDAELYNAMLNTRPAFMDAFMMKMFSIPRRVLTAGATFGAAFRAANAARDSLQTAVISKNFIPFIDSWKGILKTWAQDADAVRFLSSGGGQSASYVKADDPAALSKYIDRIVAKEGPNAKKNILSTAKSWLEFWDRVGATSENAARVQKYAKLRQEGVEHFEAAFEGRDLLDFAMKGSWGPVHFITNMLPFVNARMQGLYKLGRATKEDPWGVGIKGGMMAVASLALWASNWDDERYRALEDWDKRQYWHFWIGDQHFRIPKPFEVGAVFGSLFETAADVAVGNEDIPYIIDFIKHTTKDTFAVDLLHPQVIKPFQEIWANKSTFTKRPIEGMAQQRLLPGARATERTSETLRVIGEKFNVSPLKLEAIINGYFSTFGTMALFGADILTRQLGDFPVQPRAGIQKYPLIGRFMRDPVARSTKYTTRFYELLENANQLFATVNEYKRTGDMEAATRLYHEGMPVLKFRPLLNKTRRRMSDLNQRIRKVMTARHLSPEKKREMIDQLTERKNDLTQRVYQRYMELR